MRSLLVITFLLFSFTLVNAQTSAEGVLELRKLELQISNTEKILATEVRELAVLRIKYSDEYSQVKAINARVKTAKEELAKLYIRRKELLTLGFTKNLPTTQTDLLRIIIIQNERIIELLERMQPRNY